MLYTGVPNQTGREETKEIIVKKIKHNFSTAVVGIGILIFFYWIGWNNWVVKLMEGFVFLWFGGFIADTLALGVNNNTVKTTIKGIVYAITAIAWFLLT